LRPVKVGGKAWLYKILLTLAVAGSSAGRAMSRVKIIKRELAGADPQRDWGTCPQTRNNLVILNEYKPVSHKK